MKNIILIMYFIVSLSLSILHADDFNEQECQDYDIRELLADKGLDPLSRNKRTWKRLFREYNIFDKYDIQPESEYQRECIKKYILKHAFDIAKYSREL